MIILITLDQFLKILTCTLQHTMIPIFFTQFTGQFESNVIHFRTIRVPFYRFGRLYGSNMIDFKTFICTKKYMRIIYIHLWNFAHQPLYIQSPRSILSILISVNLATCPDRTPIFGSNGQISSK